ncbi:MAG: FAD-binding protein [Myxococcales bacterium]|nr:FAD-binding protein [Myxococcales bacterium]
MCPEATPIAEPRLVGPPGLPVDARGYVHLRTEHELQLVVAHARANGLSVRVRGSAHSVPAAIHSDARLAGRGKAIELLLDRYDRVRFDDANMQVTVEAGCRFGHDPRDPTMRSSVEGGLCHKLQQRGWALPILGGVSHVTVAGFLSTGSAGGSASRGFHDAVVSLRLVDGQGRLHVLSRSNEPDRFHAALVSMGLFGIVSAVTLQCVPSYDVQSYESIVAAQRAPFRMTDPGPDGLESFLRQSPFARVLWWPQRGVDKLVVWAGRPMTDEDYDTSTGPRWAMDPVPYSAFEPLFGTDRPTQAAAAVALAALGGWRGGLRRMAGERVGRGIAGLADKLGARRLEAAITSSFSPEDTRGPRRFRDVWWRALPMDDGIDERLLPTTFTELWLPLSQTARAMERLRDLYQRHPEAAGYFAVEIYAAAESGAWMSPAYGGPAVRLNVFWFQHHAGDPRTELFPPLWDALSDLGARVHWGKLLPTASAREIGQALRSRYPRWQDFLRVREELDPDGIFLTAYWRNILGLADESPTEESSPLPGPFAFDAPRGPGRRGAPLFRLGHADAAFLHCARKTLDLRSYVPAPPSAAYALVASAVQREWVPGFRRRDWITEPGVAPDAVVDEVFSFGTVRVHVLDGSPGRRWLARIVAASVPVVSRMLVCLDFSATPDGGADVRWRVAYDPSLGLRPLDAVIEHLIAAWLRRCSEALAFRLGRDETLRQRSMGVASCVEVRTES